MHGETVKVKITVRNKINEIHISRGYAFIAHLCMLTTLANVGIKIYPRISVVSV